MVRTSAEGGTQIAEAPNEGALENADRGTITGSDADAEHREFGEPDANLEATELHQFDSGVRHRGNTSNDHQGGTAATPPNRAADARWYAGPSRFWRRQVSVVVPADAKRDHLALERTFLAYVRTSLAMSMVSVLVAQLFRLQHSILPDQDFGYYKVGEPLAATFQAAALVVILIGAYRFWLQQNAMVRGKVYAGGWDVIGMFALLVLLGLALFAITVGVGIHRETRA